MDSQEEKSVPSIRVLGTIGDLCDLLGGELVNGGEFITRGTPFYGMAIEIGKGLKEGSVCFCRQRPEVVDLARKMMEAGALALVSKYPRQDREGNEYPCILVNNVSEAVAKAARFYRSLFPIKAIGVTGTCGKTTTKELICCMLEEHYQHVHSNVGNGNDYPNIFNTCMRLTDDHEIYVQEIGGSCPGAVERSTGMVRPSACVITNIGNAHLDMYKTIEGVAKDKLSLARTMEEDGVAFLNGDDERLASAKIGRKTVYISGKNPDADYYYKDVDLNGQNQLTLTIVDNYTGQAPKEYPVIVNIVGKHNAFNITAAFAVAQWAGVSETEIVRGLEKYRTSGYRQNLIHVGGYSIIQDCFSISDLALISGMRMLSDMHMRSAGRKIAVLGAKAHFGEDQDEMLGNVADKIKGMAVDQIVCYGPNAKHLCRELWRLGRSDTFYLETMDMLVAYLGTVKRGDVVLLEAGMLDALTFAVDSVYGTAECVGSGYYRNTISTLKKSKLYNYRVFAAGGDSLAVLNRYLGDEDVVQIPDVLEDVRVTHVYAHAFKEKGLVQLKLGKNVVRIGTETFLNCSRLESVEWNDALRIIGPRAFSGCASLKSLTLPESLLQIGEHAFCNCVGLEDVYIPAGAVEIDKHAFDGCPNVRIVHAPK